MILAYSGNSYPETKAMIHPLFPMEDQLILTYIL